MRRRLRYVINGIVLALGAPGGLLLLHAATRAGSLMPSWVSHELQQSTLDYVYVTGSTALAFAILGFVLGTREEQLEAGALTDPLTGLWNRRHAMARLEEELARAHRYGQPLSVLFIDVDWLKQINDQGGHSVGDDALKNVADAIRNSCRVVDLAARYAGDEYFVIASNTAASDGVSLAERIRAAVKTISNAKVSVSIGVADLTAVERADVTTLCQAADMALYRAKSQGRDRVALAELNWTGPRATSVAPVSDHKLAM